MVAVRDATRPHRSPHTDLSHKMASGIAYYVLWVDNLFPCCHYARMDGEMRLQTTNLVGASPNV